MNGWIVIDDFLSDFDAFDKHARSLDYAGEKNPADGVMYPDISTDIPSDVMGEAVHKVQSCLGYPVQPNVAFLRLTNKHTKGAPHQAHTDAIMGNWSLMLYMQDGEGGTSFVEHESGMVDHPETDEEIAIWQRDTNVPEAWKIRDMVNMRRNRATIFPAGFFHRAEPIGGFGESVKDGRLVFTIFFS